MFLNNQRFFSMSNNYVLFVGIFTSNKKYCFFNKDMNLKKRSQGIEDI